MLVNVFPRSIFWSISATHPPTQIDRSLHPGFCLLVNRGELETISQEGERAQSQNWAFLFPNRSLLLRVLVEVKKGLPGGPDPRMVRWLSRFSKNFKNQGKWLVLNRKVISLQERQFEVAHQEISQNASKCFKYIYIYIKLLQISYKSA